MRRRWSPGRQRSWTTTTGETPRSYRVYIEKVNDADPHRNMVLRVADQALLAQTGGIVQGMSGSPILQNGRLVGAVTHVLVNDPTRGYGIFAQTMLEQAHSGNRKTQQQKNKSKTTEFPKYAKNKPLNIWKNMVKSWSLRELHTLEETTMDKVKFLMSDTGAQITAACREALEQKGVEVTVVEKDGLKVLQKMLAVRPAGGAAGCLYARAGCAGRQAALQCRRGAPHLVFRYRRVPE